MFWKTKIFWGSLFLSILIGLAIILPFYFEAEKDDTNNINHIFDIASKIIIGDIQNQIDGFIIGLTGLSHGFGVLGNFSNVTKAKFDKLANQNFDNSLFTVAYNPFVYDYERNTYETFLSSELNESIIIRQQLNNGTIIVSVFS